MAATPKGYLRSNYRERAGMICLIYHSDSTAGYLTAVANLPTGIIAVSQNMSQILVYRGDGFVVYNPDGSTA